MDTQSDPRLAKQAAVLDLCRNGASITEAADAAQVSRRTVHHWAEKDPAFGTALRDAQKNKSRVVTEGQLESWKAELAAQEAAVAAIEAELLEVAAPAHAGDEAAKQRQADLRSQLANCHELIQGLRLAVESAETHLSRAREQEAEAERQAAAAEAAGLGEKQRAAAERIDRALAEIEAAWADFARIARERQAVARKAGQNTRAAFDRVLVAATFADAPQVATALGLDRRFRASARPLKDVVS